MAEPMFTIYDFTDAEERRRLALFIRARAWPIPMLGCTVYENKWTNGHGHYSQMKYKGRQLMVHRVLYECEVGPIEYGMCLDHRCRFRACIDPDHLFQTTIAHNTHIGNAKLFRKADEYNKMVANDPPTQTIRRCAGAVRAGGAGLMPPVPAPIVQIGSCDRCFHPDFAEPGAGSFWGPWFYYAELSAEYDRYMVEQKKLPEHREAFINDFNHDPFNNSPGGLEG